MRSAATKLLAGAIIFISASTASAQEGDVFLKVSGGGSYPILNDLQDELEVQGEDVFGTGYSLSVSLGRIAWNRVFGAELYFAVSRYPEFFYANEADTFDGQVAHYDFMLLVKRNLYPGNERLRPWLGIGLGYGYSNIARSNGKNDGFQGMASLQVESRVASNIALFAELTYISSFTRDEYDSKFLEASAYDAITGSDGEPLSDRFMSVDFRVGITAWLRPRGQAR